MAATPRHSKVMANLAALYAKIDLSASSHAVRRRHERRDPSPLGVAQALIRLPCGLTAIKRLRRLLGHDWRADRPQWWGERIDDLATLTTEAFADKHDVSVGAVSANRQALLGRRCREEGWWRDESVMRLLMSTAPAAVIADELGIAAGSVGRLRHITRRFSAP